VSISAVNLLHVLFRSDIELNWLLCFEVDIVTVSQTIAAKWLQLIWRYQIAAFWSEKYCLRCYSFVRLVIIICIIWFCQLSRYLLLFYSGALSVDHLQLPFPTSFIFRQNFCLFVVHIFSAIANLALFVWAPWYDILWLWRIER